MKKSVALMVSFFIISSILFSPQTSLAGIYLVNDLKVGISAFQKGERGETYSMADWGHFIGYVAGVIDSTSHLYNLPDKINVQEAAGIFIKYLDDHQDEWNSPASEVLQKALKKAFPKP